MRSSVGEGLCHPTRIAMSHVSTCTLRICCRFLILRVLWLRSPAQVKTIFQFETGGKKCWSKISKLQAEQHSVALERFCIQLSVNLPYASLLRKTTHQKREAYKAKVWPLRFHSSKKMQFQENHSLFLLPVLLKHVNSIRRKYKYERVLFRPTLTILSLRAAHLWHWKVTSDEQLTKQTTWKNYTENIYLLKLFPA
jgi:hypothetical protein